MDIKTIGRLNEECNDTEDTSYIFNAIEKNKGKKIEGKIEELEHNIKNRLEEIEIIFLKEILETQTIENIEKEEKTSLFRRFLYYLLWPIVKFSNLADKIEKKNKILRTTKEKFILVSWNIVAFILALVFFEIAISIIYLCFHYLGIRFPIAAIFSIIIWRFYKNKRTFEGTLLNVWEGFKAIGNFLWNMIKGIGASILGLFIITIVIGVIIYIISGIGLPRFLALLFFA